MSGQDEVTVKNRPLFDGVGYHGSNVVCQCLACGQQVTMSKLCFQGYEPDEFQIVHKSRLTTEAAELRAGPKEGLKWLGLDEARRSIPSGTLVLNRRKHGRGGRWLYGEIYKVNWEDDCYNEIFDNQFLRLDD